MNESVTLRPRLGQVLTGVIAAIVLASLVSFVVVGDLAGLARYAWPLLLVAWIAWMLFWSPAVTVDPGGVVIRNLIRENRVTWPAIQRIDTKYSLELYTSAGTYTAWAAPAPGRHVTAAASRGDLSGLPESARGAGGSIRPGDLPTSSSGAASYLVRRQWEALRDAGHLDTAVIEGSGVVTRWLWANIAVSAALTVATVLALVL